MDGAQLRECRRARETLFTIRPFRTQSDIEFVISGQLELYKAEFGSHAMGCICNDYVMSWCGSLNR